MAPIQPANGDPGRLRGSPLTIPGAESSGVDEQLDDFWPDCCVPALPTLRFCEAESGRVGLWNSCSRVFDLDPNDPDRTLEAAAVSGNRDALAQLLVAHGGPLSRRLAARLELNPFADFAVEDVLQEVFLDVFRGIGTFRFDQGTSFRAWLNTIADNRLASMIRHRCRSKRGGRHQVHSADASRLRSSISLLVRCLADEHGETGSEHAARGEMLQALREGLAELPHDQRAAVEAHYLDHRSVDATAAELEVTQGAIRGLLYRAKQSLRTALGKSSRWFYRK